METHRTHSELQTNRELLDELFAPRPTVIGIEGGPCSGKTTLVNELQATATAAGRQLVVLPEAASRHIEPLIADGKDIAWMAQYDSRSVHESGAEHLGYDHCGHCSRSDAVRGTDTIIVADRVDIGAYLNEDEYRQILGELGRDKPPMLDLVDQLYYLPSVAQEQPARYEALKSTNVARYETTEQAIETCRRNLAAVSRHPELHVLWGGGFRDKLLKAAAAIVRPERESELKLAGRDSDVTNSIHRAINEGRLLSSTAIIQSYHRLPDDNRSFRLRKAMTDRDEALYYCAIKIGQGIVRDEQQRRISLEQYEQLKRSPQQGATLEKQRYEFLEQDYTHEPMRGEALRLRQWAADWYIHPRALQFDLETPVMDETEARDVLREYHWYNRLARSAADLAIHLASA